LEAIRWSLLYDGRISRTFFNISYEEREQEGRVRRARGGEIAYRAQERVVDISDDMTAKELDKRIHERHTNGVNEDIRDIMVKGDVAEIDHGEELEEHREVGIPGLLVSRREEGEGKGKEGDLNLEPSKR
jgi:hypothetical protein